MTKKRKQEILDDIENEGFDYTFRYLTSYDEEKDKKFIDLVTAYCQAAKNIEEYLGIEE